LVAQRSRGVVHLVWVLPGYADGRSDELDPEAAPAAAQLETWARELRMGQVQAVTHLVRGNVAQTILDGADEWGADLIAMATHRRGGVQRFFLGSVADKVIQAASQAVLLVPYPTARGGQDRELKYILVPLDGSEHAWQALGHARALGHLFDGELRLLFVPHALDVARGLQLPGQAIAYNLRDARRAAAAYLGDLQEQLTVSGLRARAVISTAGLPARRICRYAAASGVDVIVMSTHGRGGLSRWAYGSVADGVRRGSPCPVLLVRARDTALTHNRGRDSNPPTCAGRHRAPARGSDVRPV
jgi:nucleotide-binding universal stress UspA family protein